MSSLSLAYYVRAWVALEHVPILIFIFHTIIGPKRTNGNDDIYLLILDYVKFSSSCSRVIFPRHRVTKGPWMLQANGWSKYRHDWALSSVKLSGGDICIDLAPSPVLKKGGGAYRKFRWLFRLTTIPEDVVTRKKWRVPIRSFYKVCRQE